MKLNVRAMDVYYYPGVRVAAHDAGKVADL